MKKLIFGCLALVLALVAMLGLPSIALADSPTTVVVNWSGAGGVDTDVNTGDSNAGFNTFGDNVAGSYTATDSNNNPYSYGVDNFSSYLNAGVVNGYISTGCLRINSYSGMYGSGGQLSTSNVAVVNGTASMAYRSTTNYAAMVDASYGFQLPGGHNFDVNAEDYTIDRSIDDARGNSASVLAVGSGAAVMDCMSAEASGVWTLKLGQGAGCYTDANFNATGAGAFTATVDGNNQTTSVYGTTNMGQVHTMTWTGGGACSIPDFSMTAW